MKSRNRIWQGAQNKMHKAMLIKETQVREILEKNIPEMIISSEQQKSLYKTIDSFTAFTKVLMKQGNLTQIKNCFVTAEYLLENGTDNVKLAMKNLYVFSVTSFMELTGAVSKEIKALLPTQMVKEYKNQTYFSFP